MAFLDMGLVFGLLGMRKMGIAGAALTPILSRAAAMAVPCYILVNRLNLTAEMYTPERGGDICPRKDP
jgi:Na+-driven multidrug efflux pump